MASRPSLLQRLSPSRDTSWSSQQSLRNKHSEYDLSELSPRAHDSSPPSKQTADYMDSSPDSRRPSLGPIRLSDDQVAVPGYAKKKSKVLFAGPPPPIAQSTYIYHDADDHDRYHNRGSPSLSATISSVFFDRPQRTPAARPPYEPDSVWRSIQRREKALQKDLQHFLDVQAAGLSAGLGRPLDSPSRGPSSDIDGSTRGGSSHAGRSARLPTMDRSMITGEVMPVRQPRPPKIGLRAARTALAKSMTLLTDLKAEEDASLDSALRTRKAALAQLKKLSARRSGIADELRSLESDDDEPLAQELKELRVEHDGVSERISELEGELVRLKNKRQLLEKHMGDISSRREAGLSGYRGALREVDGRITAMLSRPPVKLLDVEVMSSASSGVDGHPEDDGSPISTGGIEFMRLRPERRTADMASDWWGAEIKLLEDRKEEVARDRAALEEGLGVWGEAVQLVSVFEAYMRQQVMGDDNDDGSASAQDEGKGKALMPTLEENMRSPLAKIRPVISALDELMTIVQEKGWNLLVCAIGAELEAFKEAEEMMQASLEAAGFGEGDQRVSEGSDPPTAIQSRASLNGPGRALVDAGDDDRDAESDNGVPPDLFTREDSQDTENSNGSLVQKIQGEEGSSVNGGEQDPNAVPPEFLAEH